MCSVQAGDAAGSSSDLRRRLDEGLGGFSKVRFRFAVSELLFRTAGVKDVPLLTKWFNDHENTRWMDDPGASYSLEEVLESIVHAEPWTLDLMVEFEGQAIGYCTLYEIDAARRTAVVALLLGERGFQNRGFGKTIVKGLCAIGFEILGLVELRATVTQANARALKIFVDSQFKIVDRRILPGPCSGQDNVELCLRRRQP